MGTVVESNRVISVVGDVDPTDGSASVFEFDGSVAFC